MSTRPLIIWAQRRTGGTNLASQLIESLGLPTVEHEPFNEDRVYGGIGRRWLQQPDPRRLSQELDAICAQQVCLKHCVETVPAEVSLGLASAAARAGYRHLFLHRRKPLQRLLSLHFAKVSGIWGPRRDGSAPAVESTALNRELPIADLIRDELHGSGLLSQIWQRLLAADCLPQALAYEDLFEGEDRTARLAALRRVLADLGLYRGEADLAQRFDQITGRGDQKTRDHYASLPGVAQLEAELRQLRLFKPALPWFTAVARPLPGVQDPRLAHAAVDQLSARGPFATEMTLGGVVVLHAAQPPARLQLQDAEGRAVLLQWGLESPRMLERHPQAANAAAARFRALGWLARPGTATLSLQIGEAAPLPLFALTLEGPSRPAGAAK